MKARKLVMCGMIGSCALLLAFGFARYVNYRESSSYTMGFTRGRATSAITAQMSEAKVAPYEIPRETARLDDLRLVLAVNKERFSIGEDVMATAFLVNASPDILIMTNRVWAAQAGLTLQVTREGSPVKYLGGHLDFGKRSYPCDLLELRPRSLHGVVVSLSSGTHSFDLSLPGRYQLGAVFSAHEQQPGELEALVRTCCPLAPHEHAWTGRVVAEPVAFAIDGTDVN